MRKCVIISVILISFLRLTIAWGQSDAHSTYSANPVELFDKFYLLSKKSLKSGNYIDADGYIDTALMVSVSLKSKELEAKAHLQKGIVKKYLNDDGNALEHLRKSKNIFLELESHADICRSDIEIADYFRKIGKHPDALFHLEEAQKIYNLYQLKDTMLLIQLYNRFAAVHQEYTSDFNIHLLYSRKALALAKSIDSKGQMAVSMNEIGFFYKNFRALDSAEYYFMEAEKLFFSDSNFTGLLHVMNNRAMLYMHNNHHTDLVVPLYNRMIFLNDSLNSNYSLRDTYGALSRIYLSDGDSGRAYHYFSKYHDAVIVELFKIYDINLYNANQKYENDKMKYMYDDVSYKLNLSSQNLKEKNKEQKQLFYLIIGLSVSIVVIILLLIKLRTSNHILKAKNSEKDSLIQEIHHRVKNNLQFISSLVSMQLKTTGNAEESKTLLNASRRINAMALVHEMLYNQSDKQGISIKPYLEELVESLNDIVQNESQKLRFNLDIAEADFNVSDAIALGMIASELVSNSLKHAFDNTSEPAITISLKELEAGKYEFNITDNGKGFDAGKKSTNTLGLRLVDIFSRQLKGEYTISGTNGFNYVLLFTKK